MTHGVKDIERVVELVKKLGAGSVKYVKYSYSPATDTHHVKIVLLRPVEWRLFSEVVKELERSYTVRVYAPHANAIRLDLKKRS
ncbi:hypothetical protein P186_0406 [Pyrobaculum ferrireducens]|jgi:predicted transcriptional regulator|uniref:Uncharacterized protein n=1 Tax=Pyrobaculum ferrireducens TaxID=1104324 RepID=G7VGE9_9CREN|nr:hypothetical protein P186_0406 [Pyrobaculum ferrireducens]